MNLMGTLDGLRATLRAGLVESMNFPGNPRQALAQQADLAAQERALEQMQESMRRGGQEAAGAEQVRETSQAKAAPTAANQT